MPKRQQIADKYIEALEQEKETRRRELLDHPEKEQSRLKYIEFERTINIAWLPMMEEYLNGLGKLWFGYKMRLRGTEFLKKPVSVPAFTVTHKIFALLAIFEVVEDVWMERETPFEMEGGKSELKTEVFKRGFRCRVVLEDNGQYEFQDDNRHALFQSENGLQVDQAKLTNFFSEAYLKGPEVIFHQWKTPLRPDGSPFYFAGDDR